MSKLQWKGIAILVPLLIAFYLLYPTFSWYTLPTEERASREMMKDPLLGKILNLGLDLRGGTHLVLELKTEKLKANTIEQQKNILSEASERAIEILRNRIDQFGVAEPLIARQGEKWIVVQLPGIKDPERAKQLIGKTALLEFRLVDDSRAMENLSTALREKNISFSSATLNPESLPKEVLSLFPTGYVLMQGRESRYFLVKAVPELTGAYLTNAKVQIGGGSGFGYPEVSIEFNPEGAKIFSEVTETNINRNLAIVLDGVVQSAPTIRTRIPDGKAVVEGSFTSEEAKLLATVLRAGALPVPVEVIEERTVGPSLGEDSIRAGVWSSIIGLLTIVIFMGIYYKGGGLLSDTALGINLILLLAGMAYFRATLTLPGIAGIILSLGMGIDANVLILERIREELQAGKSIRMALDLGYDRAFSAILDSHVTTLISAIFLYQFGTGPVKGFAVTLIIGLIVSLYTAIFVTRTYYHWRMQNKNITTLSVMKALHLLPKTNIDFVGKRYWYLGITGVMLLSGIASLLIKKGPKWGLDFTGGTILEVKFQPAPSLEEIRKALQEKGIPSFEIQSISGEGIFIIRTKVEEVGTAKKDLPAGGDDSTSKLETGMGKQIQTALEQSFPGKNVTMLRKEFVGPTVGKHLIRETFMALLLTFVGIVIYVAFRFRSGIWGSSGVIALVHDVLATIGLFSIVNKEITITIVAALLTIAGYSISDTIVVFDRMREKLRLQRTESLANVINQSINETLSRTIITSLTVLFVVLALYLYGGKVIHDFAFAMLFGVAVGTYSSIAVAAPIVYEWVRIHSKGR